MKLKTANSVRNAGHVWNRRVKNRRDFCAWSEAKGMVKTMKNKKDYLGILAGELIIYIGYIIAVAVLKEEHNATFFMGCGFVTVAFAVQVAVNCMLASKYRSIRDYFFNLPIHNISGVYLFVEILAATVIIFLNVNTKIGFVVQIIILTIFMVLIISGFAQKDILQTQEAKREELTGGLRELEREIKALNVYTDDPEIKKLLSELSEIARYGVPCSDERVASTEAEIRLSLDILKDAVKYKNAEKARETIKVLEELFDKRNTLAKTLR